MMIQVKRSKSEFSKIYNECVCDSKQGRMIMNEDESIDYTEPGFDVHITKDEYIIVEK